MERLCVVMWELFFLFLKYILVRISMKKKVVVIFKLLKSYCELSDMNCNK